MRLYAFPAMAALCALARLAPDTGAGTAAAAADAKPPADPKPDDPKLAEVKAAAEPKKVHVIWAMPGHESFAVGSMVRVPADAAETLRATGKARLASKEEVKAFADAKRPVRDFG